MKYKVGDKVLVRQWDDMAKEFSLDCCGKINLSHRYFNRNMRGFCGTVQEICDVLPNDSYYLKGDDARWCFDDDMIERKVNEMTKEDLRTGYIVTLRNGKEYMTILDVDTQYDNAKNVLIDGCTYIWYMLDNYEDNLRNTSNEKYDIMKIEKPTHPLAVQNMFYDRANRILLWEREEPKEMTMDEIEKILGYPVKVVEK